MGSIGNRLRCFRFVLCILLGISPAQAHEKVSLADLNKVAHKWNVDDGLIGGQIIVVIQSKDGILWVGNREGLFRFNGREFTRYETEHIPEVKGRFVHRLCAADDNSIWLATTNGQLASFADGKFSAGPNRKQTGDIGTMIANPSGGIITAGGDKGLTTIHAIDHGKCDELARSKKPVSDIQFDPDRQELWIISKGRISQILEKEIQPVATTETLSVGRFLTLRDGSLAAIGREGMLRLEEGSWQIWQRFDDSIDLPKQITTTCEDADGRIWFGTPSESHWIWEKGQPLRELTTGRNSTPSPSTSYFSDREGNVWVTSFSGLFQVVDSPFVSWSPPPSIAMPRVLSVEPTSDGNMLFTTFGGICQLQAGAEETELIHPRPAGEVTFLESDPSGGYWIGNKNGYFARVNDGTETRIPIQGERPLNTPTGFCLDDQGVAWISAFSGIYRGDPEVTPLAFVPIPTSAGIPAGYWQSIATDPDGGLVAVHKQHGIFGKARGEETWRRITSPGDPVAHRVGVLRYDPEGRLWGCRAETVACWIDGTPLHQKTEALGFDVERLTGMVADDEDGFWFNTLSEGTLRVSRNELFAKLGDPSLPLEVTHFTPRQGLASLGGSFTSDGIMKSKDGRIWVATVDGLSAIQPRLWAQRSTHKVPPAVEIESISIDGQPHAHGKTATIPAGTQLFAIHYAARSLLPPSRINYRYRLAGHGESWIDAGTDTQAIYQNLPPGRYLFEVTAAIDQSDWPPETTTFDVYLAPLWWQRSSVRIGALVLLLGVSYFILRSRLRSLQKKEALHASFARQLINSQEAERKRIAGELHDSLGQSLLVVKNLAALGKISHSEASEPFAEIADSASSALAEVRTISHALRPPELDRLGLTKAIQSTLDQLDSSSELSIRSNIEPIDGTLSPEQEISIYRLLQESLNNAIKHAHATEITVTLKRLDPTIQLHVEDNGRGFDPDAIRAANPATTGIGLDNMIERARLMNGNLQIRSAPGQGTRIRLSVPSL